MSRRSRLTIHLKGLEEIRDILAAMKNLSLIETRKLSRLAETHGRMVSSIEAAAGDCFAHFRGVGLESEVRAARTYVVLGSERGFCGDFNEGVAAALEAALAAGAAAPVGAHSAPGPVTVGAASAAAGPGAPLLLVGRKLAGRFVGDPRVVAMLEGPTTVEDVPVAVGRVLETLAALRASGAASAGGTLALVYNEERAHGIGPRVRVPLEALITTPAPPGLTGPPDIHLEPRALMLELLDHYQVAVVFAAFYASLAAEHRRRLEHMDGALRALDRDREALTRRLNALRQEEITEEIEVIMLSAQALIDALGGDDGRPS